MIPCIGANLKIVNNPNFLFGNSFRRSIIIIIIVLTFLLYVLQNPSAASNSKESFKSITVVRSFSLLLKRSANPIEITSGNLNYRGVEQSLVRLRRTKESRFSASSLQDLRLEA